MRPSCSLRARTFAPNTIETSSGATCIDMPHRLYVSYAAVKSAASRLELSRSTPAKVLPASSELPEGRLELPRPCGHQILRTVAFGGPPIRLVWGPPTGRLEAGMDRQDDAVSVDGIRHPGAGRDRGAAGNYCRGGALDSPLNHAFALPNHSRTLRSNSSSDSCRLAQPPHDGGSPIDSTSAATRS